MTHSPKFTSFLGSDVSPRILFRCTCIQCARKGVKPYIKCIFMLATEVNKCHLWKIHNWNISAQNPRASFASVTHTSITRCTLKVQIRFSHRYNMCSLLKTTCHFISSELRMHFPIIFCQRKRKVSFQINHFRDTRRLQDRNVPVELRC
jgi:hypothetical protein